MGEKLKIDTMTPISYYYNPSNFTITYNDDKTLSVKDLSVNDNSSWLTYEPYTTTATLTCDLTCDNSIFDNAVSTWEKYGDTSEINKYIPSTSELNVIIHKKYKRNRININ